MEWLTTLIEDAPNIIQEAAKSTLGILALLIISLAVIAILFFRTANEKIRLVVFIFLFVGVVGYSYAIIRISDPRNRWYVVVASVNTVAEAATKVSEAKANGFDQAEYLLQPQSSFIAVIVGKDLTTAQAIKLKSQAKHTISSDPYLWPFTK